MCDGAKAFQENVSALYAESRKLIRYDGRVNFVTFLTYLHARAIFVAYLTYYYCYYYYARCPQPNTIPKSPHDVRSSQ
jgi:hypothetical protein